MEPFATLLAHYPVRLILGSIGIRLVTQTHYQSRTNTTPNYFHTSMHIWRCMYAQTILTNHKVWLKFNLWIIWTKHRVSINSNNESAFLNDGYCECSVVWTLNMYILDKMIRKKSHDIRIQSFLVISQLSCQWFILILITSSLQLPKCQPTYQNV